MAMLNDVVEGRQGGRIQMGPEVAKPFGRAENPFDKEGQKEKDNLWHLLGVGGDL
jgi:hypothetical protein